MLQQACSPLLVVVRTSSCLVRSVCAWMTRVGCVVLGVCVMMQPVLMQLQKCSVVTLRVMVSGCCVV